MRELYAPDICHSLEGGLFSASPGVELADMSIERYSTSFIGVNSQVLRTTSQNPAVFELSEKLTCYRATSSPPSAP